MKAQDEAEFGVVMARLARAFRLDLPKDEDPRVAAARVRHVYFEALADLPLALVQAGANDQLRYRTSPWFPVPGEIRESALEHVVALPEWVPPEALPMTEEEAAENRRTVRRLLAEFEERMGWNGSRPEDAAPEERRRPITDAEFWRMRRDDLGDQALQARKAAARGAA